MPQITITLLGKLTHRAASVDGVDLTLAGIAGAAQSVTVTLPPGEHALGWSVDGEPGAKYSVALSGDTDPWTKSFDMTPEGSDDGIKRFSAR